MSISSEVRKAGPFSGNDVTTAFPFAFKVFSAADVLVVRADSNGAEYTLALGTDYTVSLNADQNANPGGIVTKASALATGESLAITSQVSATQPTQLTNSGGFYPSVINDSLDRLTILIQQLREQSSRSLKVSITSSEEATPDSIVASMAAAVGSASSAAAAASGSESAASASASSASASAASANASAASANASAAAAGTAVSDFVDSSGLGSHRNRLINGDFSQNVRALTSVADDTYFLDRWYALTESGNVTVAQLTDPESGAPFGIRLTQPDASPKRMGFAQIIESKNIRQYASRAMHLAARLRLSTGAAIRYAVIEHTGTADVVTSDVVNNWASTTFTPSNFFIAGLNILSTGTITPGAATWGEVSAWAALGSGVKNVIVFIWTESQVAQNVTLDCSRIQYEPGVIATPHEWRMNETSLCSRHARINGTLSGWSTTTTALSAIAVDFGPTGMFANPAVSLVTGTSKGLDPSVAFRDISAPTWTGAATGGYLSCTTTATTANKLHNLLAGAVLFTSEL